MYVLYAMLGFTLVYLIRLIKGPTIWDRLLAMNIMSTKIIIIIVLWASYTETSFYLDAAIIYALFGFIGTIFITLFLAERGGQRGRD